MKYTLHQNSGGFNARPNWDQVVSGEVFRRIPFLQELFRFGSSSFFLPFAFFASFGCSPSAAPPRSKISRDARNQDLEGRTEVKVGLGRDGMGMANGMGCMGWVTAAHRSRK